MIFLNVCKSRLERNYFGAICLLYAVLSLLQLTIFLGQPLTAVAQIESPDRRYLFREDKNKEVIGRKSKKEKQLKKKRAEGAIKGKETLPFDISASSIDYDSSGNKVVAQGNVLITYSTLVAEAQKGQVDLTNNRAFLKGDVRLTDLTSEISAEEAEINIDDGSGVMKRVAISFEEGDYSLTASEASRDNTDTYSLKDALLTTCDCPVGEECAPWSISATEADITRNGYGRAWNAVLRVQDFPVLYVPFVFFPAKNERQSGLLPATFSNGKRSGFSVQAPLFLAFDNSTDATITGVYENQTRYGPDIEFRKVLSRKHRLQAGVIYFDESAREGKLLGTNVDGLSDPSLDENRVAGYLDQNWQGEVAQVPLQWIVDAGYASDDLFIREYERDQIAKYNSRFITSQAVLRAPIGGTFSSEISAEGNQAIVSDDDLVFQRVPELNINGLNSFRVFGENPFGLKLALGTNLSSVNFIRKESYEGQRSEIYERATIPFHFRNFFDGSIEGNVRASSYQVSLDDQTEQDTGIASSSSRVVPGVSSKLGTVVERVFPLEEENPLKLLGELGKIGRNYQLTRVKHTIEPGVRHRYVPEVDQDDTPQFDSLDRLSQKNVVTFQLVQRLLGRYEPRNTYLYGIEEVTPELKDLGNLRSTQPLDRELNFGYESRTSSSSRSAIRRGSIEELVQFKLSQSYDIEAAKDPEQEPYSDLAADLILFPNDHFRFRGRTDYNLEEQEFRSYALEGNFVTKRGDLLLNRLRFIDGEVRQLESGLEIRLTEFIRLGYYSRYDDLDGEFIEQKAGLRFYSECRCWIFDVDVTDKLNPDETKFSFNVTLVGLGQVGNTFFTTPEDERRS